MDKLTFQKIAQEKQQDHSTRKNLYKKLESYFGKKPIVSFFTSFVYPVSIEDDDAKMLEEVLQRLDTSKGLILLISSPGGSALAAERVINVCRNYSGTKDYEAIIPSKAKSAATMICLGASKLIMSQTSELGPIDPQYIIEEGGVRKQFSAWNIVQSYKKTLNKAVSTKGNLEPYIQQLSFYNPKQIREMDSALMLSKDIAVRALKTGMLSNSSKKEIENKIKLFLVPEKATKVHGRPIFINGVEKCKLNADLVNVDDNSWKLVRELYIRLDNFVSSNNIAKCIESRECSFRALINARK